MGRGKTNINQGWDNSSAQVLITCNTQVLGHECILINHMFCSQTANKEKKLKNLICLGCVIYIYIIHQYYEILVTNKIFYISIS